MLYLSPYECITHDPHNHIFTNNLGFVTIEATPQTHDRPNQYKIRQHAAAKDSNIPLSAAFGRKSSASKSIGKQSAVKQYKRYVYVQGGEKATMKNAELINNAIFDALYMDYMLHLASFLSVCWFMWIGLFRFWYSPLCSFTLLLFLSFWYSVWIALFALV